MAEEKAGKGKSHKCQKCGKLVDELHMEGLYQYSPADPIFVCKDCQKKVKRASRVTMIVFFALFALWGAGLLFVVIPNEMEEIFAMYLFSGILGLPILAFVMYKVLGG